MYSFSKPDVSRQFRFLKRKFLESILAVIPVALMTVFLFLLRGSLNTSTVALLYLIPVLISTTVWGLWPGVFSAFIAFLAYNYFFLLPYYTFIVHENQDIIALLILLVVAVFNSQLVARARSGQAAAVTREREVTLLYELSLDLVRAGSPAEIAAVLARKTSDMVSVIYLEVSINPMYSEQAFQLSIPKDNLPDETPDAVFPLETVRVSVGEIRLWLNNPPLTPAQDRLLRAYTAQGTLALERMALAQAENRAQVLEESDRLKSAILSSVTHELRTPLATIKASTTSLISDEIPWETPARHDLLSVIDEETDYLNYLVGNLLDMSRIEAGALKPNRHWNILSEIIDGVMVRLHRTLRDFIVDIHIPDDLPVVPVDYSQMEQVILNLLNNAAKFAPPGSCILIEASLQDKNTALISVKNEGPQVKADHLDRIFDKFYRITEPEKISGTGLGLSICKGIVEAHGGRIWAENIPGGLAFRFTIPLRLDGNLPPQVEAEEL